MAISFVTRAAGFGDYIVWFFSSGMGNVHFIISYKISQSNKKVSMKYAIKMICFSTSQEIYGGFQRFLYSGKIIGSARIIIRVEQKKRLHIKLFPTNIGLQFCL